MVQTLKTAAYLPHGNWTKVFTTFALIPINCTALFCSAMMYKPVHIANSFLVRGVVEGGRYLASLVHMIIGSSVPKHRNHVAIFVIGPLMRQLYHFKTTYSVAGFYLKQTQVQ